MTPSLLLAAALAVAGGGAPPEQAPPALLPGPPRSDARWAPIERFKKRAPPLTYRYEARSHRGRSGEVMPYRLLRPRVEPGRRYPVVLFLHGSGGSGSDNVKQLDRANWFGALLWALPENQERHPWTYYDSDVKRILLDASYPGITKGGWVVLKNGSTWSHFRVDDADEAEQVRVCGDGQGGQDHP